MRKQEWKEQQLKSLNNATLNPSLYTRGKRAAVEAPAKHHIASIFPLKVKEEEKLVWLNLLLIQEMQLPRNKCP